MRDCHVHEIVHCFRFNIGKVSRDHIAAYDAMSVVQNNDVLLVECVCKPSDLFARDTVVALAADVIVSSCVDRPSVGWQRKHLAEPHRVASMLLVAGNAPLVHQVAQEADRVRPGVGQSPDETCSAENDPSPRSPTSCTSFCHFARQEFAGRQQTISSCSFLFGKVIR